MYLNYHLQVMLPLKEYTLLRESLRMLKLAMDLLLLLQSLLDLYNHLHYKTGKEWCRLVG